MCSVRLSKDVTARQCNHSCWCRIVLVMVVVGCCWQPAALYIRSVGELCLVDTGLAQGWPPLHLLTLDQAV